MKFRTPISYGFMIALSGTLLMLSLIGLDLLGPDALASNKEMIGGTILFLMIYLFLLFGIYFVLKQQKEEEGKLSFQTAMIQGFITSLSTALFSVLFTYLFYELIYPEYVPELLQAIKEKMELGNNIPSEKIEAKLIERKAYFSTANQSLFSLIGNFITGAAFTFLLSFFL